jgi:hypothetical protein
MTKYKPNYIRITNKIFSLLFISVGFLSMLVERDATFMLFSIVIGIYLFFHRKKIIC